MNKNRNLESSSDQYTNESINLSDIIRTATSTSSEMIGKEQINQINDLQTQIKSLENELSAYKKWNTILQNQMKSKGLIIKEIVNSLANVFNEKDKLMNILKEKDNDEQIRQLVLLIKQEINRKTYERKFHVDLNDKNQSIILQRLKESTKILNGIFDSGYENEFGLLDFVEYKSFESREKKINKFISGKDVSNNFIVSLLLKEIGIVDCLCKFSTKIEGKLQKDLQNSMKEKQKSDVYKELKEELQDDVYEELKKELKDKVRNELKDQLLEKVNQKYIQKLEKQIREENEPIIKKRIEKKLIDEMRDKLKKQIEEEEGPLIRKTIEKDIRNQLKSNDSESCISEKDLSTAFYSLCEAQGFTNYNYTFPKFISLCSKLSKDISQIRQRTGFDNQRFTIISVFENLIQQIQQLDQLHTQTRGLLVRQAEIISNLRSNNY